MDANPSRRRPWLAALLGLLSPGLGHAYAGRLAAGVVAFLATVLLWMGWLVATRTASLPSLLLLAAIFTWWVAQGVHAARAARRAGEAPRAWSGRPLGLVALFAASGLVNQGAMAAGHHIAFILKQASGSMLPTVQQGDVLVFRPGAPVERGAVVVYGPMPGAARPEPVLKRVVAMGGDLVEVRDGRLILNGAPVPGAVVPGPCTYWAPRREGGSPDEQPCERRTETLGAVTYDIYCTPGAPCGDVEAVRVPPGHVFVLGDFRDHSADSRVHGPVPVDLIQGRAEYVYYSMGPAGVRWDRFGFTLR